MQVVWVLKLSNTFLELPDCGILRHPLGTSFGRCDSSLDLGGFTHDRGGGMGCLVLRPSLAIHDDKENENEREVILVKIMRDK